MEHLFKLDQHTDADSSATFWWGLIQNLPCAVFVLAGDGACRYVNPAARRLLGYATDDLGPEDLRELGSMIIAGRMSKGAAEVGETAAFAAHLKTAAGELLPVELKSQAWEHEGIGRQIVFACDGRDRPTAEHIEAALQRETLFSDTVLRTADVIILVLDNDGGIVRFNPFMEDLGGYRLSEVVGKNWFEIFIPTRDRARIRDYLSVLVRDTESRGVVNAIVAKDGSEYLIEWHNKVIQDPPGKTVGVLCIGLDITRRRQVENWMESLVETTQDAVISIDRQGRIVLFNPAAELIFGYEKHEICGENVTRLMPEPYAGEHDAYIERYEKTGERRAIGRIRSVEAMRKDGSVFPIELSVTEIPLDREVHYAAFIRDISEKVKLQQLVAEKERLAVVGATAAGLVHEIGNPLNAMSMTAQLLERRLAKDRDLLDETVYTQVGNLREELRRLNALLQDFRMLARQDSYDLRPISLADVCGEVYGLHEQAYRQHGVQVLRSFPDDLPLVGADRDKLKQALINLCNNALEAMPEGGTLEVRAFAGHGEVTLEVRDSGVGIKEEIDVFEPFATTKPKGTGLGLMITRKIVAAHGGTVTYESSVGKGTVFRITLPESGNPTGLSHPERDG